jgi:hypothetical protein
METLGRIAGAPGGAATARWGEAVAQALLFAAAFTYFWPFATASLSCVHDEGIHATAAVQILDGRLLYRDIVQSVKLPVYLLAGVFRLFGARLIAARVAEAAVCALLVVFVYRFTAARTARPFGMAAAACTAAWSYPFWNIVGWDWEGVLLVLVAAEVFSIHLSSGRLLPLFATGALAGAVFFFQPDNAAILGLALAGVVLTKHLLEGRRAGETAGVAAGRLGALAGGVLAVLASVAIVAFFAGFLGELVRQMVVGPLVTFSFIRNAYIPYPLPPFSVPAESWWYGRGFAVWSIYLLPLAVVPAAMALSVREVATGDCRRWADLAFVAVSVTIFAHVFPRSDVYHLVFALVGVSALSAWLLSRLHEFVRSRLRNAGLAVSALVLLAALAPAAWVAVDGWRHSRMPGAPLVGSTIPFLKGLRIEPQYENEFRALAASLAQRGVAAGDEVMVLPVFPILYPVLGIRNPTRFNAIEAGTHEARDEHEVISVLRQKKVGLVVFHDYSGDYAAGREAFSRAAPHLDGFLARDYEPVETTGLFTVLAAKTEGP